MKYFPGKKPQREDLSAPPSSHLPNMSQEERLEFSVFLSRIKTGSGAGFWDRTEESQKQEGSSLCVCFINISISGETAIILEPALVVISLFINKRAAYFLFITRAQRCWLN